jgi:trimeric autotransporter adhesin
MTQWRDRSRHELISNGVCTSSPLILDLDGDGIHLSSLDQGVRFDLLGGGQKVLASWTDGKDALLALDRNGNGTIDGAAELFGNATGGAAYDDGFAALADLDDDGNGAIDARDRAFGHLLLWRDANRDGVSAPSELVTLADAGIRRLSLRATRVSGPSSLDAHGNQIPLVTEFERRDGTRGALVDAFLRYRPIR